MFDIINSHVHIYPSKIALKATNNIGVFYDIKMNADGNVDGVLAECKNFNIKKCIVHSVATTKEQVHKINLFILEECKLHGEFVPFMTLHPDMSSEEIRQEIAWAICEGFKGIKLHPDFQKFAIDDANAEKIYNEAKGVLPILFHTGDSRYSYSNPEKLARMLKKHTDLVAIAAHFGGYSEWDKTDCYKGLDNVYFDTSSSLAFISPEEAKRLIATFGAEKFFFASDYPMWSVKDEIDRFMKIDLTNEEREMIFSKNITKLLGL